MCFGNFTVLSMHSKFPSSPSRLNRGLYLNTNQRRRTSGAVAAGEQEMVVPLIVGGTTVKPRHNRLVDMKDYLLTLLGE